ncbi:MAG: DUF2271 domain-containing protein [Clostridiales bacterium]|nr:DUF2271 domain-containing protein [Clostridiales bacterium]
MAKYMSLIIIVLVLTVFCSCTTGEPESSQVESPANSEGQAVQDEAPVDESGKVVISFDFISQAGYASNQFAVWICDADVNYVKTLYATRFTANGGYENRPDSIPLWVLESSLASMSKLEVNAITGATPKTGNLSYTWDLTDKDGNAVPSGEYSFFVEGSLRWKNRVLYSGKITVGGGSASVQADAEFFFKSSASQPALTDDAPECSMIGAVTASFVPAGER